MGGVAPLLGDSGLHEGNGRQRHVPSIVGKSMHIFIDESGTFTGNPGQHSVSLVGAPIIPDARIARVEKQYQALRADLPKEKGEVKGRLLSEDDVDSVVSMLARNDIVLEIKAIDLGMHSTGAIAAHQAKQAALLTENLTEQHHPDLRAQMFELRHRLEEMTPQLYIQSVATFELIATVIDDATLFYCQRIPKELGAFHWVIDGKGKGQVTDWENWWSLIVMPAIQSRSLKQPMIRLEDADYSHFERFRMEIPEYMKPHIPPNPRRRGGNETTDLKKLLMESFRFSSDPESGLEMADIVVNATRRAMTGNLRIQGWGSIRRLMIAAKPQHYIGVITLAGAVPPLGDQVPYMEVLKHFSQGGKKMLAPRNSN